jgi:hypothetical protein
LAPPLSTAKVSPQRSRAVAIAATASETSTVELELVRAPTDVAHAGDALALDARRPIAEPLGQPTIPDVRRLDDVVVDAHDEGNLVH